MNRTRCLAPGRHGGFTLVELLVVMAVIGALVGLLLPAVQQSREASRRLSCQNNLKQVGLAFLRHHDALGYFPTGGWDNGLPTYVDGLPVTGLQQKAGWGFQILPYLEAENTWRGGQATDDRGRVLTAIGTPNAVFFCPTRRGPQTVTYSDPERLDILAPRALCDYAASNLDETGIVREKEPNRISDITDGTSQTLMVGEKRLNLTLLGQWQPDDNDGYSAGWSQDTVRKTDKRPHPDYYGDRGPDDTGEKRFGSSHPGRFNALLADGSVRTIPYTIDKKIFEHLGDKGDGQIINNNN